MPGLMGEPKRLRTSFFVDTYFRLVGDMGRKVVVIGGGIVGLSCAYFAKREGFDVTVVDPDVAEGRASYGNAGVLALCEKMPLATVELLLSIPKMMMSGNSPLTIRWNYLPTLFPWMVRFALASAPGNVRRATQNLHALMTGALDSHLELANAAGVRDILEKTGWIKAWEKAPADATSKERDILARLNVDMRDLSKFEISDLAPGFTGVFEAATLYRDCFRVASPGRYVDSIQKACASLGVAFVREKVTGFRYEDDVVKGAFLESAPGKIDGDFFVVAGGAWSKILAEMLGDHVPLDTERGYHFMLEVGESKLLRAPLLWQEKSIVLTQMEDGLRMTSSVEFAGLNAPARYENIEHTFASVQSIVPALSLTRVKSRWLGFRPSVPDSVPVIGRSAKHRNCIHAFGHGHLGLTLGPVTGRMVAEQLAGKTPDIDIQPFSPSRFN
jgi:D-amino-acid dehydrogenase